MCSAQEAEEAAAAKAAKLEAHAAAHAAQAAAAAAAAEAESNMQNMAKSPSDFSCHSYELFVGQEKGNDDNNKEKMSIRSEGLESVSEMHQRQPSAPSAIASGTTASASKVRKVSAVSRQSPPPSLSKLRHLLHNNKNPSPFPSIPRTQTTVPRYHIPKPHRLLTSAIKSPHILFNYCIHIQIDSYLNYYHMYAMQACTCNAISNHRPKFTWVIF